MRPNLLIDPLPEELEVVGLSYPIHSGFRTFVLLEMLLVDREATEAEKVTASLSLVYGRIPPNTSAALDALLWFYRCGGEEKAVPGKPDCRPVRRVYDFAQDDAYIYAAFLQQYGIDLNQSDLHWWKFKALFRGLNGDCEIVKIMEYRSIDLQKIRDKEQRRRYARLQAQYRLDSGLSEAEKAQAAGMIFGGGL